MDRGSTHLANTRLRRQDPFVWLCAVRQAIRRHGDATIAMTCVPARFSSRCQLCRLAPRVTTWRRRHLSRRRNKLGGVTQTRRDSVLSASPPWRLCQGHCVVYRGLFLRAVPRGRPDGVLASCPCASRRCRAFRRGSCALDGAQDGALRDTRCGCGLAQAPVHGGTPIATRLRGVAGRVARHG